MKFLDVLFPVVRGVVIFIVTIITLLLALRLIFNYADPNPFGRIGRFAYRIKKITDRIVYPVARFLSQMGVDNRIAPFISILVACVAGYFVIQIVMNVFLMLDGIVNGISSASISRVIGSILYGILGIYSLLIVIRIVVSWVSTGTGKLVNFLMNVTDPILIPFRKMIPPLGKFDISPIIVLLLLSFLQSAVAGVFLN